MNKVIKIAITMAVFAAPASAFAGSLESTEMFSQSAAGAESLEASRDLATKALENLNFEGAPAVAVQGNQQGGQTAAGASPAAVKPVHHVHRPRIHVPPMPHQYSDAKPANTYYDASSAPNVIDFSSAGGFETLGRGLTAPVVAPVVEMARLTISLISDVKNYPAGVGVGLAVLALPVALVMGAVVGLAQGVAGFVMGVGGGIVKICQGKF